MIELNQIKKVVVATVAFCAMWGGTTHAQKLPTATAPGAYLAVGGTYSEFEAQYPQQVLGGVGVYADLNVRPHLGIEAEIRWLRQNEIAGSNETTYLVGPRYEFRFGRFSPYVRGLVGDGKLVFPYGYGYGNYLVYGGGAGLDVRLTSKIRLRAVDFEYQRWPQFNFGPGYAIEPITPYGVSAGLSYEVFHTGGWRKHRYK